MNIDFLSNQRYLPIIPEADQLEDWRIDESTESSGCDAHQGAHDVEMGHDEHHQIRDEHEEDAEQLISSDL